MTRLDDELSRIPPRPRGTRCSISELYKSVEIGEREALIKAVDSVGIHRTSSIGLSKAIAAAYGLDVHRASIDRHRRGDCVCARMGT